MPCSPDTHLSEGRERCILVAVRIKRAHHLNALDSVRELGQLASTAGCQVVGCLTQGLPAPHPRTYVGDGKLAELAQLVEATGAETVFFDDELSPSQLRNVGRRLGQDVRVADRTSLILDIFRQRAATREGKLQVALAETQYQLPRLTRLWTHLERQAGGGAQVRGIGETQREVDQRLLRARAAQFEPRVLRERRRVEDAARRAGPAQRPRHAAHLRITPGPCQQYHGPAGGYSLPLPASSPMARVVTTPGISNRAGAGCSRSLM